MTRYETLLLLTCASRVAQAFSHRSRPASELSEWLERNPLGFDWSPETAPLDRVAKSGGGVLGYDLRLGRPVPRQQLVEAVVHVIVDAVEDVGEVGLRIKAAHLRALDERHRARQGFAAGIRSGEEPVFPPDAHRPFILPMSVKSGKFIIVGIPISV